MSHACYYVIQIDGTYHTTTASVSTAMWDETPEQYNERLFRAFFRTLAERVAFNDCTDEVLDEIVWEGRHVHYVGWQPGMVIEFADDETGEIVYSGAFPEWDH